MYQAQQLLLQRLTVEQVEEALTCLHWDRQPENSVLRQLEAQDWLLLATLLNGLMTEKQMYPLH
jgi:hypothetical protein